MMHGQKTIKSFDRCALHVVRFPQLPTAGKQKEQGRKITEDTK
jgi:hypothetical protein